jgi:glycosyltransferase involved in cell wall biosynthesis
LQGGEVAQLPRINYGALRNPLKRKLIKWALNHANAVVALTEFQKQQMKKLADVPCVVIPFGVDENQFVFQQKKLQGIRKFLHVGSLIPVKDQLTLLRCFSLYHQQKPAVLRMVGEGYLESYLKKVCEELKIKDAVFFEGFHRHTELYPFFAEADILLHTAVYEGQCLAVTEALASGVLVAGTQVGLIADQGDRCCITVDVGDAAGLAQKLLSLRDEEFHAKVTEAKRWSEAHTFSKMVSKIKDTIHLQLGGEEK